MTAFSHTTRAALDDSNVTKLFPNAGRREREIAADAVDELAALESILDRYGVPGEIGESLAERLSRFFAPHEVES